MKKILVSFAAVLFAAIMTTTVFTSCGGDDNDNTGGGSSAAAAAGMKVKYYVKFDSQSTFDANDVTVEYTDANGKTQTQTLTSLTEFSPDPVTLKGVPNKAEMKVSIVPKDNFTEGNYDVQFTFGIGAVAVDAQGRETGTIKITPEYISHTAIRAEKKRIITRTKTVSISSDGSINVN